MSVMPQLSHSLSWTLALKKKKTPKFELTQLHYPLHKVRQPSSYHFPLEISALGKFTSQCVNQRVFASSSSPNGTFLVSNERIGVWGSGATYGDQRVDQCEGGPWEQHTPFGSFLRDGTRCTHIRVLLQA